MQSISSDEYSHQDFKSNRQPLHVALLINILIGSSCSMAVCRASEYGAAKHKFNSHRNKILPTLSQMFAPADTIYNLTIMNVNNMSHSLPTVKFRKFYESHIAAAGIK